MMLLEEALRHVAFGTAHKREWTLDNVWQNPIGNAFVVFGQVEFGDAVARDRGRDRDCVSRTPATVVSPAALLWTRTWISDGCRTAFERRLPVIELAGLSVDRFRVFALIGRLWHFADDLLCGFVFTQTLERRVAQAAVGCPLTELDFADQFGLYPGDAAAFVASRGDS